MKTKTSRHPEFYVMFETPNGRRDAQPMGASDKEHATKLFVAAYPTCKIQAVFTPLEFARSLKAAVAGRTA